MKKLLLAGLPVLIVFMALPFVVTLMVVMTTTAAAECRTQTNQTAPTELGDLGPREPVAAVDGGAQIRVLPHLYEARRRDFFGIGKRNTTRRDRDDLQAMAVGRC